MSPIDASAVISATQWIGTWLINEGKYIYDVQDQVERLQDELKCMLAYLENSDQAQQAGDEGDLQVANYTKKIREIAFKAEDVIDTYILKVASEIEGRSLLTRGALFLVNSPLIYTTRKQIDAIIEKAKEANERLNRYKEVGTSSNNTTRSRPIMLETYAHTEDRIVVGFDDYVETLVEKLTGDNERQVIGIVGTGGAGKTTIARKVFHHPDVTAYFKHKAWVCISQQWNRRDVLYEILRSTRGINDENEKNWSDGELIEKLYHFLNNTENYLIVLDDMWETEAWDAICSALPQHHKGSKIIITTRKSEVSSYADPKCFVPPLRLLHNKESWDLFKTIAIDEQNSTSNDIAKFENLGMEMVAKCGGLPLAVVTLAGLLRAQKSLDDWERVNKACGDNILKYGRVRGIMALSYDNLPSHLKPCFLYLGVFAEDVEIPRDLLTRLWIAEGLVTEDQQRGQEILEDVAKRYLDDLVGRCILQVVRKSLMGNAKMYRLHDLLRDFCVAKAKDESFLEVFSSKDQSALDAKIRSQQARRATFHSCISLPTQNVHLRSLIRFGKYGPHLISYDDESVGMRMNHVYQKFKYLRVLNLWGIKTSSRKLPTEIGKLIHLRYLSIWFSNFDVLPKGIGNLRNLLTLDIGHVGVGNREIAFTFSNLTRIRYLSLGWSDKLPAKNLGLDKLKDLQALKGIKGGEWMIKEMPGLSQGIKKLEIREINSMDQLKAVYRCPSILVGSLQTLTLRWLEDENLKLDLEKLEKCQHLKKLSLDGRINEENSAANSIRFPPNIVCLVLRGSRFQRQDCITNLGQHGYLKFLYLWSDSYMGVELNVGACEFPQLEVLMLCWLESLEEWRIEKGGLACLKELRIRACKKLQRLPDELRAITTLQKLEISEMPSTFCKRVGWQEEDGEAHIKIRKGRWSSNSKRANSKTTTEEDGSGSRSRSRTRSGEDVHIIQHIPTIRIHYVKVEASPQQQEL